MNQSIEQYSVYWVDLNPTKGAEMNKNRPCVVISPSEMNDRLRTAIVAPVTSRGGEGYPTRVRVAVQDIVGFIVLDQIRAIDRSRLCERIGVLDAEEIMEVKSVIKEMLVD